MDEIGKLVSCQVDWFLIEQLLSVVSNMIHVLGGIGMFYFCN